MPIFVCFIYRFGTGAVLPNEAFSSLNELVTSLSSIDGFVYKSTEFRSRMALRDLHDRDRGRQPRRLRRAQAQDELMFPRMAHGVVFSRKKLLYSHYSAQLIVELDRLVLRDPHKAGTATEVVGLRLDEVNIAVFVRLAVNSDALRTREVLVLGAPDADVVLAESVRLDLVALDFDNVLVRGGAGYVRKGRCACCGACCFECVM